MIDSTRHSQHLNTTMIVIVRDQPTRCLLYVSDECAGIAVFNDGAGLRAART